MKLLHVEQPIASDAGEPQSPSRIMSGARGRDLAKPRGLIRHACLHSHVKNWKLIVIPKSHRNTLGMLPNVSCGYLEILVEIFLGCRDERLQKFTIRQQSAIRHDRIFPLHGRLVRRPDADGKVADVRAVLIQVPPEIRGPISVGNHSWRAILANQGRNTLLGDE